MIKGKKINLRVIERNDLEEIRKWYSDPKLRGIDGILLPLTVPQMEKKYEDWAKEKHSIRMLIETKDGTKLLGMLIMYTRHGGVDLIIPIQNQEHKDAAIETTDLALSALFMEFDGKNSVSIWIPSWNTWLIDIAKEYGMKPAGRERQVGMREGKYFDSVVFDLLKAEYLTRK